MKQSSEKYWEMYWQQGHLTSFGESFKNNYTGVLHTIWLDFFNSAKINSTVLDIGTGAGALLEIGLNSNTNFKQLIGIDSAKVNAPDSILQSQNTEIMCEVNAKAIPLGDNSVDYVVSQFGIEYSDLSESLPEIARVLVQGGQFQFVAHDQSSVIIQSSQPTLEAATVLLKRGSSLDLIKTLVKKLQQYGKQSAEAEIVRKKFNKSIDKLLSVGEKAVFETDFPNLMKAVMSEANYPVAEPMINAFRDELYGQQSRLSELCNAAFSEQKFEQLTQLCATLNLSIDSQEPVLDKKNNLLAIKIVGSKKA